MAETPIGPGTLLAGRFVLEDLLTESEGARFYRAHDSVLARDVAVHVVSADDQRSSALLSAARTSATVSDGHLLRVLDAASSDGVSYVVNEWGSGISLDKLLASEGPLSPRRAAWVVKEVAEAISTAHRHGVAHGRLIPENVVISDSGSVKLIGFVIEAVLRGREQQPLAGGPSVGEHEADVLNLGALLYAALVARWPGTSGSRLPAAPIEHGRTLRPRQVRAGVPRALDAICERVLHRDGNNVVPITTAHEVYAALADWIGDPSAPLPADAPAAGTGLPGAGPAGGDLDPEATQAGAPVFAEDDSVVGWQSGGAGVAATGPDTPARAPQEPHAPDDPESTQLSGPVEDPEATRLSGPEHDPGSDPAFRPRRTPPPPPPPFPEPEERPLFADTPRRPAPGMPAAGLPPLSARSHGLPPSWGPDADTPTDEPGDLGRDRWPDRAGRSWMRLALTVGGALVLVVAVIVAFNLGRGAVSGPDQSADPGSEDQGGDSPQPVQIAAVSDFDPGGDPPEENPDEAPLAIDDDPSTAWRTSTYYDPIDLLKEGVGLRVDLGEPTEVSEVALTLNGSPTTVELMAAPEDAEAPTDTDGLSVVAREEGAGSRAVLQLEEPTTTRYLVVWLTSLPQVADGFRGEVAEIVVRS